MSKNIKYKNKTPSIIDINGRQYAVNLEWVVKPSPDDTPIKLTAKNIKEMQPSPDYDCYAGLTTYDESYLQAGFSSKVLTPVKTPSLALAITGKTDKTELYVLKIDSDRSYLLLIQNGIIDPDTDILGDSEEIEAYAKEIQAEQEIDDSNIHILNEDVAEALLTIETLMAERDKKVPPIKSISFSFKEVPKIVYVASIGAIVLAGSGFGYMSYSSYIQEQREIAEQQERMERTRMQREAQLQITEENAKRDFYRLYELKQERAQAIFDEAMSHRPEPWNSYGEPRDFLEMCINNIRNTPVFRSTWRLRQASCNGERIESVYERSGVLNVSGFLAENPNARINTEGNIATISRQTLYQKKPIDRGIPQNQAESNDAKFNIIGFLQDRPDIAYQFNRRSTSNEEASSRISRETRNVQRRIFNIDSNRQPVNYDQMDNYVERLAALGSEEDIEAMQLEDLPAQMLNELRDAYREDWQQEYLVLRSSNAISWFAGLYRDIPGLRVSRVDLNILPNNSIEWVIESPFFYKM